MDLWFNEDTQNAVRLSFRTKKTLYHEESKYQKLDIIETDFFGRVMLLDGLVMLTEKDEFIYHDMITHVPMAVSPHAKNALIIGGGDGGTARELLRYPSIERVDMVDIDEMVSRAAIDFFPKLAVAFKDKRLFTHYENGIEFIAKSKENYDLIIIDSTDPIGPGEGLFTTEFYTNCKKRLIKSGILVSQSETAQWNAPLVASIYEKQAKIFPVLKLYQAFIPTYPSGHWLFSFGSEKLDPIKDLQKEKWESLKLKTQYYNTEIHVASFALPNFIKNLINI